jgi:hypothetical protein
VKDQPYTETADAVKEARAANAEFIAAAKRWHAEADRFDALTPEQQAAEEAEQRAESDRQHAEWKASGQPDWFEEWKAKRGAERSAANAELAAIDAALDRVVWDDNATDEDLELAEARNVVDTDAWHARRDHLWPSQARTNAQIKHAEDMESGRIPCPAGTRERLRAERLQKEIDFLTALREAELTIEIHHLRSAA